MTCPIIKQYKELVIGKLKQHDFFYEYSEDMRYYDRGLKQQRHLELMMSKLEDKTGLIDLIPKEVRKNWNLK